MSNFQINYFYGITYDKCTRSEMEDVCDIKTENNILYYIICDGHGSALIPKYIKDNFINLLDEYIQKQGETCLFQDLCKYIYDICYILDQNVKHIFSSSYHAGTTMLCLIFYKQFFYIVNLGDSVVMIGKNNNLYYKNIEHKPNNITEKMRILTSNAKIINNRIDGNINISRSFGDFQYKKNTNIYLNPIIPVPDISVYAVENFLNTNTWFLLASDGLFIKHDYIFIYSVINYMLKINYKPQNICNLIINYCKEEAYSDNVAFILILLDNYQIDVKKAEEFNNIKKEIYYKMYDILHVDSHLHLSILTYSEKKKIMEEQYLKYITKFSTIQNFVLRLIKKNMIKNFFTIV